MTRNEQFLAAAELESLVTPEAAQADFPLWTDQYNNVVQLLRIS